MTIRKTFLTLAGALALLGGVATLTALPTAAQADVAASKAMVDAAKAQGVVGEQGDGLLGFVGKADPALTAAVAEINAGRSAVFQDVAAKTGVSPQAAGEAAAQRLIAKLPPGQFYKPLGGSWTRK